MVLADNYAILGTNRRQYNQVICLAFHSNKIRAEWKDIGHYFLTRLNNCSDILVNALNNAEVIAVGDQMVTAGAANIHFVLEMASELDELFRDGVLDVAKE